MTDYIASFYRGKESPSQETILQTLHAIECSGKGFFPAYFWRSQNERLVLEHAQAYERTLIPAEFYIQPGVARIPFEGSNGTEFAFTESDEPSLYPATLVIKISSKSFSLALEDLVVMFKNIVKAFSPDYSYLYDQEQTDKRSNHRLKFDVDIYSVPMMLYWINYYGREWVRNIGQERLRKLSKHIPFFEWLEDGGVLFAIQTEPYEDRNPVHVANQQKLEKMLGLKELHAKYPNRGI
ncbi:MAG: hypothetical protein ABI718_17820 [Acidobacteriota bacterium]